MNIRWQFHAITINHYVSRWANSDDDDDDGTTKRDRKNLLILI